MIEFLNYQPFGDHGVMSLLSIRIIHIIMIVISYKLIKECYYPEFCSNDKRRRKSDKTILKRMLCALNDMISKRVGGNK